MHDAGGQAGAVPEGGAGAVPRGGGLLLLLALGLALLRFWRLGAWSLWIDEAYTWADYHHSLGGGQIFNPLGYRLVCGCAAWLASPPDELALRFLPAAVGALCVPLSWWALRPLLGGRRAAAAALLVAASAWHVYWSQNARFYTLTQALALLGAGLYLRGLLAGGLARTLAGLLLAAAAAAFHPSAGFLALALVAAGWVLALGAAGEERARRRRAALVASAAALLGALVGAPWAWSSVQHHLGQKPSIGAVAGVAHLAQTCGFFLGPWLAGGALVGLLFAWRERAAGGRAAAALVLVTAACATLLAAVSQTSAQYLFVLLPWIAGLACVPLGAAPAAGRERGLRLAWLALLVLPSLTSTMLYFTVRRGERPRWREAYELVAARREPGDLVLGHAAPIGEFYLGGATDDLRRPRSVAPIGYWQPDEHRRQAGRARRVWAVVRPQWFADMRPEDRDGLARWLREDCRLVERFPVEMEGRDLDLLVYLRE